MKRGEIVLIIKLKGIFSKGFPSESFWLNFLALVINLLTRIVIESKTVEITLLLLALSKMTKN